MGLTPIGLLGSRERGGKWTRALRPRVTPMLKVQSSKVFAFSLSFQLPDFHRRAFSFPVLPYPLSFFLSPLSLFWLLTPVFCFSRLLQFCEIKPLSCYGLPALRWTRRPARHTLRCRRRYPILRRQNTILWPNGIPWFWSSLLSRARRRK
jgi:hypothetical protein